MLSTGERPQPPLSSSTAILNASQSTPVSKSSLNSTTPMWTENSKVEYIQHIWIVTGPAGCGKSTVGRALQIELGVPFLEGDDFHPTSNKDKMSNGIPLTDEDRWDWLISLRKAAIEALSPSESNNYRPSSGVVVACSALKQKYRDVMRVAAYGSPSVQIHFVYLKLDEKTLFQRVTQRKSHYMKSTMVQSQLRDLEEPKGEWDALIIDANHPPEQVQKEVIELVRHKQAESN